MKIKLPPSFSIDANLNGNLIRQVHRRAHTIEAMTSPYSGPRVKGLIVTPNDRENGDEILLLDKRLDAPVWFKRVLLGSTCQFNDSPSPIDLSEAVWLRHPNMRGPAGKEPDYKDEADAVTSSWRGAFSYVEGNPDKGIKGLRSPQIGALHAIHAHWSISNDPATIVMPTGTGKTDTMIAVFVSVPCQKLIVVVPTDALRAQLATKFMMLGILREDGCHILSSDAHFPIVTVLKHKPKAIDELDLLFASSNVLITTSQIAGQCEDRLQERMAQHCPFLFIDEAHHAEATTWKKFRARFGSAKVLQFTATPFREDDRLIDGKIIFKYPLKKAQLEGYFTRIQFKAVYEFHPANSDNAIAARAIEQLRLDSTNKKILMARVATVERAKAVFSIYAKYKEFRPVQIHTGIKSQKERAEIRRQILSGESRIVVCVDMLGEGFDLPELKIAAFHDIRKSLAVTLQLAGRFTRARHDLGEAIFIANVADIDVREELQKLYAREPDWNHILPDLSDTIIDEQVSAREFLEGFASFSDEIPLKSLRPATSTVIYKTRCQCWSPENFKQGIPGIAEFAHVHHSINHETNTLVIVTARKVPIEWTEVQELYNWDWELYVVMWDRTQKLLFINNSSNSGEFRTLAQAIAGEDVELIKEWPVFRCLAGVNRLKLSNVGLLEQLGRLVRYTGRMGADVEPVLSDAQKRNTKKAVIFGTGFAGGAQVSVGASRKGRIWSFSRVRLSTLASWCRDIGAKVLDESIDPEQILRGTLDSTPIVNRPQLMPIGIDWPEQVYKEKENSYGIKFDDTEWALHETSIDLVDPAENGELRFKLFSADDSLVLSLNLFGKVGQEDFRFSVIGSRKVWFGNRSSRIRLEDFFYANPPVIWFADGSSLEGNMFTSLKTKYLPYEREKIHAWDWAGIDLTKESQGVGRETDSIQFRVIEKLDSQGVYDLIFDDDGAGESADVVGVRLQEEGKRRAIEVELYHCKYSAKTPGQRIEDLYAVCGQAQKSVYWMYSSHRQVDFFSHLLKREPKRRKGVESTRYQKGNRDTLIQIREMSKISIVRLKIFVVQPGLSKEKATTQQLELLSVTENYLMETYKIPFTVIASP